MDQLITGINEWANKYGKNAEDFYPDVEEFATENEPEIDEDILIGGGDHDLWWFTEEEKKAYRKQQEQEEFFGVTVDYDENGTAIYNIDRDIWMGMKNMPVVEMTIEVPDSWLAWTPEEQTAWLEYFEAEEW